MKNWPYTHIQHRPRKLLNLDLNEYAVLDLVYKEQVYPGNNGVCESSIFEIATALGLSKGGVHGILKRSMQAGYLENVGNKGRIVTEQFYSVAYIEGDLAPELIRSLSERLAENRQNQRSESERNRSDSERDRSESERNRSDSERHNSSNNNNFSINSNEPQFAENGDCPIEKKEAEIISIKGKKVTRKKKEADPAFQTVLDAFHEAHTVFHQKMADQHGGNFLPFQWTPKELKSLKEFLPIFRRAIAPKAGCQPEEIDAARLALNMTALCQRVESMDEWTKKNCYSPSGMLCHWAKISNSQAHGESRKAGRNDKPTVSNNADEARKFSDFLNGRGDTRTNMQKLLDEIDAITIAASGG